MNQTIVSRFTNVLQKSIIQGKERYMRKKQTNIQENNVACKKVKCKRRFDVDKKDKSKP